MNKKTRSIKSEKWRHALTSGKTAWTNEQMAYLKGLWRQMVETKIETTKKSIWKRRNLKKTVVATEAFAFRIKPLTYYFTKSDLKLSPRSQREIKSSTFFFENVWLR